MLVDISLGVIALAALVLAVWEGVMERRHNRLSVAPRLTIRLHAGDSLGMLGCTVSNEGLGPAIVTNCLIKVDGKAMENKGDDGWNAALGNAKAPR